jgi:hypothetical protein
MCVRVQLFGGVGVHAHAHKCVRVYMCVWKGEGGVHICQFPVQRRKEKNGGLCRQSASFCRTSRRGKTPSPAPQPRATARLGGCREEQRREGGRNKKRQPPTPQKGGLVGLGPHALCNTPPHRPRLTNNKGHSPAYCGVKRASADRQGQGGKRAKRGAWAGGGGSMAAAAYIFGMAGEESDVRGGEPQGE